MEAGVAHVSDAHVDATELPDTELLALALTQDQAAWSELVRRFEPVIRTQLGRTMAVGQKLLASDSIDDALGEFWIALIKDDREWLRRFDPQAGKTLAGWLGVLAWDVGNKHVRKLRRQHAGLPIDDLDLDHEPWQDRASRFYAFMDSIRPEVRKKRRFKWR